MAFTPLTPTAAVDDGTQMKNSLMQMLAEKKKQEQQEGFMSKAFKTFGGPVGNVIGQTFDGKEGINWGDAVGSMGPLGNLLGQTFDDRDGVDMGAVGESALGSGQAALGVATGNPNLVFSGINKSTTAQPQNNENDLLMSLLGVVNG